MVVALPALVVAVGIHATAAAGTDWRQVAELVLTATEPRTSSGWRFTVDYVNPADPEGKPPAVRTVVTQLAPGAAFDTSVPERCGASDAQLMAQGASACPPGSKVGEGYLRLDTGLPGPGRFVESDVVFFNADGQVVFLFSERESGARLVTRSAVQGGRTVSMAPPLPGAPPDGAAIDLVRVELLPVSREVDGELRSYVSTPSGCPASGEWMHSIEFTYADGVTQTVESASPCSVASGGPCANRLMGSDGPDVLVGTTASDSISGAGGDDTVRGRPGDDCVAGDAGDDVVRAGRGADRIRGGRGADLIVGGPGRDVLRGGRGDDRIVARDGFRDRVVCGPGRGVTIVDRRDRVRGCEMVPRR